MRGSADGGASLLRVDSMHVSYGGVVAVRDLSLEVHAGEIVALLGANGAGKTSTLSAISGLVGMRSGLVALNGVDISRAPPERRVRAGISHTPEGRRIFDSLSVRENLMLGAFTRSSDEASRTLDEVLVLFPVLRDRLEQSASSLSGGQQQQLAIGRSLMSTPTLLLLDEPSLGLAPQYVDVVFDLLPVLRDRGITILLVEQNVDRTLEVADRAYVLASGRLEMSGPAADLRRSSGIERAYLGIGVEA